MAARRYERVAIGHLQVRQSLLFGRIRLDFFRLLKGRQQRLSLSDLGHFRRRRKAFERAREGGAGFNGAVGRLVELRERERGA
jgi:hypothetical protein